MSQESERREREESTWQGVSQSNRDTHLDRATDSCPASSQSEISHASHWMHGHPQRWSKT